MRNNPGQVSPAKLPKLSVLRLSAGKESACNVGDLGSIPGLGRYPGEENSWASLRAQLVENLPAMQETSV